MKTYLKTLVITLSVILVFTEAPAQISIPCTSPGTTIYGLTANGEIYPINTSTGNAGSAVKNSTYPGNTPNKANGMGYNIVNQRFYYFKRAVGGTNQEFVSFAPLTNTVTVLTTSSTCTAEVHTGCINYTGTGYYTVDTDGNLSYYNILANTWTFITSNIVDQYNLDVDSCIRQQNAGDMAMDGYGRIWLITSSNSNYGLFRFNTPLPTTATAKITVTRMISPSTATPTGQSFAGIAFNPTGQIYMATKNGNRLYRLENNFSLTSVGTISVNDAGNDLTSCSFPFLVLPVYWKSFDVSLQKGTTSYLSWEVGEQQNKGFYVQHSIDGKNWEEISFIPSKTQVGEAEQKYSFSHTSNTAGTHYYRIRQVNNDGKESYSDIKSIVRKQDNKAVNLWPNPSVNTVNIGGSGSFVKAQVVDLSGRIVAQKQLQHGAANSIDIHALPSGTYLVKLESLDGSSITQKISKQ